MVVDAFQFIGLMVELWKSVPWAVDEVEELRNAKHEVQELRNEEQHHGLAKVTQDAYHRKCHACAVAEGVAHEDLAGEFVVLQEGQSAPKERNHDGEGEHVALDDFLGFRAFCVLVNCNFNYIVDHDEAPDDEALAHLNAIDPGVDIANINSFRKE